MAHSLEVSVPFVDHVLVEAVFPIPERVKIGRWWRKKRLLREHLTGRHNREAFCGRCCAFPRGIGCTWNEGGGVRLRGAQLGRSSCSLEPAD